MANNDILKFNPTLESVLMVENVIKKNSGAFTKYPLWKNLPKKMMYQTFCVIIDYLLDSGKIVIDKRRKVGWIYNPALVRKYLSMKELSWDNETKIKSKVCRRKIKIGIRATQKPERRRVALSITNPSIQ